MDTGRLQDMEDLIISELGTDEALDAITRAMSAEQREEIYSYICRMYDLTLPPSDDEMKAEALERMRILQLHPQPVKEFKESGKLNRSEGPGALYWLSEEEQAIVADFGGGLVYHVIKTPTVAGLMYTLLYVSRYPEEWEDDRKDLRHGHAIAYVYNAADPQLSEYGAVGIRPSIGGVVRTW